MGICSSYNLSKSARYETKQMKEYIKLAENTSYISVIQILRWNTISKWLSVSLQQAFIYTHSLTISMNIYEYIYILVYSNGNKNIKQIMDTICVCDVTWRLWNLVNIGSAYGVIATGWHIFDLWFFGWTLFDTIPYSHYYDGPGGSFIWST